MIVPLYALSLIAHTIFYAFEQRLPLEFVTPKYLQITNNPHDK